jgi:NADH-quinone oxidoreductase subunit N
VGLNISLYSVLLGAGTTFKFKKSIGPSELTLKYFIVGAMLTTFFLFTMVLSAIDDGGSIFFESLFDIMYLSLILFKLGAFPFHFYLRDMYSILCPVDTMFTYTLNLKVNMFFMLTKVLGEVSDDIAFPILVLSAIGSIVSGAVGALTQQKLKPFFAYSYLNSLGFSFLPFLTDSDSDLAIVYFLIYALAWWVILLVLQSNSTKVSDKIESTINGYNVDNLLVANMYVKNTKDAILAINHRNANSIGIRNTAFIVSFSSLLGLPPTLGFYAKAAVYFDLVGSDSGQLLLILALVFTPVMAYSYLRVIIKMVYPFVGNKFSNLNLRKTITQSPLTVVLSGKSSVIYSNITVIVVLFVIILIATPVFWYLSGGLFI